MSVFRFNGNQSFSKTIITSGRGFNAPNEGSQCSVVIKLISLPDEFRSNEKFYSDLLPLEEEIPIELGFYSSLFGQYVHRCLITMKQNEISQLKFDFPESENSIEILIELHSFERAPEIYSMTMKNLYEFSSKHKENANKFFQEKNYREAFQLYHRSLCYILNFFDDEMSEEQEEFSEKFNELISSIYSNMAACQLIYGNNKSVIENCSSALQINPLLVKALFRRASAYSNLNDYELALIDLQQAQKIQSNDKKIDDLLKQTKQKLENYEKQLASSLKNLF